MAITGEPRCKLSRYLTAAVMLLLLYAVFNLSAASAGEVKHKVPELPSVPPPAIQYVNPPAALTSQNLIKAGSGWQIISFSLDRVTAVWGLERMLYRLDNERYTIIDPVNHPEELEQGVAYLTYLDRPAVIYFQGANISADKKSVLKNGWNFFSCPGNLNTVSLNGLTLTDSSGRTVAAADLKQRPTQPETTWIDADSVHIMRNGSYLKVDLASSASLNKGELLALFSYEPLSLNWNNAATEQLPQITALDPQTQAKGQNVIVKGQNLGDAASCGLSLGGVPIAAADIIEWHQNYLKFKIPQYCNSGSVRIYKNGGSSNALSLAVKDQTQGQTAHADKTYKPAAAVAPTVAAAPAPAAPQPAAAKTAAQPKASGNTAPQAKQAKSPAQPQPAAKKTAPQKSSADLDMPGDIESSSKSAQNQAQKLTQAPASASPSSLDDISFEQKQIASASQPSYRQQHQQITGKLKQSNPQGLLPMTQSGGRASLSGLVTDNTGKPISHARVTLAGGQTTHSDSSGNFYLTNLPGETVEKIMITKNGYNTGRGTVSLVSGETKKLKVSLSPSSSAKKQEADKPKKGSFTVHANTIRVGPRDRRVYVYKIEVSEDGNASRHWQNTWWNDDGDVYKELICDGAEIGKLYNISVTWKARGRRGNERSDKWTKRFTSDDQKFTFDHP